MVHQTADKPHSGAFAGSYVDKQTFLAAVEQLGPRATMKEANYLLFGERRKGSGWPGSYLRAYGVPIGIMHMIDRVAVDVDGWLLTFIGAVSSGTKLQKLPHLLFLWLLESPDSPYFNWVDTELYRIARTVTRWDFWGRSGPWERSLVAGFAQQAGRDAGTAAERTAAKLVTNVPHYQGRELVDAAIAGAEDLQWDKHQMTSEIARQLVRMVSGELAVNTGLSHEHRVRVAPDRDRSTLRERLAANIESARRVLTYSGLSGPYLRPYYRQIEDVEETAEEQVLADLRRRLLKPADLDDIRELEVPWAYIPRDAPDQRLILFPDELGAHDWQLGPGDGLGWLVRLSPVSEHKADVLERWDSVTAHVRELSAGAEELEELVTNPFGPEYSDDLEELEYRLGTIEESLRSATAGLSALRNVLERPTEP